MTTTPPTPTNPPDPNASAVHSPEPDFHARAHSFNAAAAHYAAYRPSYPPALFDAVEELAGRPLTGARVADIGAGTGIATAQLLARGARVTAVEPGEGMAAELRRAHPEVALVRGNGNALPLADSSVDLVTYAQAWHWTDPARSLPEALRVLRPGGALALWWNRTDTDVPWQRDQAERLRVFLGVELPTSAARGDHAPALTKDQSVTFTRRTVRWSRRIPLDAHLANLATHSVFLVRDKESTARFLARERAELLTLFPSAELEETYQTDLHQTPTPL
ncbi:class I SAM-dependent methyltransferase [Streptomyces sp. NPDC004111]|uniref:class I SAM-dependent methyltransferase n=1 Tax=Streptomyces sp. NPDC004111 TaxID=3364690 RepID=UPI0036A8B7B8